MPELMTLTGPRLKLIPFKEEHICDAYINWLNDPEVNRFMDVRFARQNRETVLSYVRSFYGAEEKYMWGVYLKDSDRLIGTATLIGINRNHQTGILGLMIGEKSCWGKGYGTEVEKTVIDYAFKQLKLHKVTAGIITIHKAAIKTAQSAGFAIEGMARSQIFYNGAYYDLVYMGIVNKDS